MADADDVVDSCQNCLFWHPSWKFKKQQRYESQTAELNASNPRATGALRKNSMKGLCRRYAPSASAFTTVWMETNSSDWCGDYKRIQKT
ncbi:MAG: hypothetical protein HQ512_03665 [Rhodospirillales bacterium]|nr:hypothetical protein [Rhodospirillales bacterium]